MRSRRFAFLITALLVAACSATTTSAPPPTSAPSPSEAASASDAESMSAEPAAGGDLRLCTTNTNAPMEYTDPSNPSATDPIGFDIDFANAVADHLGRTLVLSTYDFGGLIPAMQAGRCDLILAGMFATAKREEVVDFVRYMKAGTAFLVAKGNPKNVTGLDSLCGAKAAYNVGSVYEQVIKDQSEKCTAAGKPGVEGVLFQGDAAEIPALQNGQVDVAFRDSTAADYIAKNAEGVEVGGVQFSDDTFGLALPKGSDLKESISSYVQQLQDDGTFASWLEKWALPADSQYCC